MMNVYVTLSITGHLCGKCHANKGVSVLLDKCVDCGYDHAMLIVGLGMQLAQGSLHMLYAL